MPQRKPIYPEKVFDRPSRSRSGTKKKEKRRKPSSSRSSDREDDDGYEAPKDGLYFRKAKKNKKKRSDR